MPKDFVSAYISSLDHALTLFKRFLEICPDNIWNEPAGGWPVSQQYYHALGATAKLVSSITNEPVDNPNPDAGNLLQPSDILATKDHATTFLANLQKAIEKMGKNLTDADLLKKNEPVSNMRGRDANNAIVLELAATHMLYHLGSCDAALRNHGLEGAF